MTKSKVEVSSNFLKTLGNNDSQSVNYQRKKDKFPLVLSFIILLLFILSIVFIIFAGIFNVKSFNVSGNTQVATKDIEDYVAKNAQGKLIFNVDPTNLENNLLKQFSLLSFARVTKELPSKLNIEVKERTKSAVIKTLENTVLVSEDGNVLDEIDDSKIENNMYEGINVVKLIDEPKRTKGYSFDSQFIKNISVMINEWNNYKPSIQSYKTPAFTDIIIDKDKNVKFILQDEGSAELSLSNNNVNIVKLVDDLLDAYNRLSMSKKIKSIDIRLENKIVVTYF